MTGTNHSQDDDRQADSRWHVIYVAVVAFTALVISMLYLFYRYYAG